ncbi:hypothetical protein [Streptomyces lydicus]|uniref:hypothetical protein n=1 Tax=Streptomyces lydicus TaxID=47763 RepID=UPI001010D63D|nr:hypothetical protein [Streptomyces lydicus]MCZ1012212.1 hypothetical protein [Streptomyces lydicus]
MLDISGLDKAQVLASLYNNAKIQGRGAGDPRGSIALTVEEAQSVVALHPSMDFEYLYGRILKVDIAGDQFEEWCYDRDNGEKKAARVIEHLRATGSVEEII